MALAKRKPEFDLTHLRDEMVEHHIAARGVRSDKVLNAMRKVKREAFLPEHLRNLPTKTRRCRSPRDRRSRNPTSLR